MLDRMSQNSNWRQFDFSLENEVSSISLSPKKSLPVLQSPLYNWENIVMNEMRPLPNIELWKRPNIFLIKCRIYLGVVENRRCSSPTIQIAVCQSADGLRVSPLKLCHCPHKSLLQKPIMALKQNNKHKTFKKLPMVTELALLFVEDWHLFEKTKAKVFETGGQEGNLYEEKASLRGNIGTSRHKRFFLKTCTSALRVCIWVAL